MSRIGVFDSGLGGYDIVRHIRQTYPLQDIVFLADQKYVPYGNRSREELTKITLDNLSFFRKKHIRTVIIACNTTSSLNIDLPYVRSYRVIDMTAKQVKEEKVLVLATAFTIKSHAYRNALTDKEVIEIALPELAGMIENQAGKEDIQEELNRYLSEYKNSGIPAILGCTHYPIIKEQISEYLSAPVYDSVKPLLDLNIYTEGNGNLQVYSSGKADVFRDKIRDVFSDEVTVEEI